MNRCRAHFQGDKCRKPADGHTDHVSALHAWNDGDKIDELQPPSLKRAERDWRRLLATGPAVRRKYWPIYKIALKNCEDYMKEAIRVRNERRTQQRSQVESPIEGASS